MTLRSQMLGNLVDRLGKPLTHTSARVIAKPRANVDNATIGLSHPAA